MPTSLRSFRFPTILYAPPASALERFDAEPAPHVCGGSLFPQEGCPLARNGREGQNSTAFDFGVCKAGPVRPLVMVPLGPSLQHAHKTYTESNTPTPA